MLGLIGRKLGMTQIFLENGNIVPVTVVLTGPCSVTQKKSEETDGYTALQIGFDDKKPKRESKPMLGHFKKSNTTPKKFLYEFLITEKELENYNPGQEITLDTVFKADDFIDVTGTSKGRGFTGVMKRHNFSGAKASHGVHEYHRHGGSIGMHSTPARVLRGTKMAGQYGNENVTVQNLRIAKLDKDKNLLFIKGAVPGPANGFVIVNKAVKKKQK